MKGGGAEQRLRHGELAAACGDVAANERVGRADDVDDRHEAPRQRKLQRGLLLALEGGARAHRRRRRLARLLHRLGELRERDGALDGQRCVAPST